MLGVLRRVRRERDGDAGFCSASKTDNEKFAGALSTFSIEAMMQDARRCKRERATTSGRTSARFST